jgi:hypothetical protein
VSTRCNSTPIGADRPDLTVPIERRDPDLATAVFDVTLRLITPTDRWTAPGVMEGDGPATNRVDDTDRLIGLTQKRTRSK